MADPTPDDLLAQARARQANRAAAPAAGTVPDDPNDLGAAYLKNRKAMADIEFQRDPETGDPLPPGVMLVPANGQLHKIDMRHGALAASLMEASRVPFAEKAAGLSAVAADIGSGIVHAPMQIFGGLADGLRNTLAAADGAAKLIPGAATLSAWLDAHVYDTPPAANAIMNAIPDVRQPDTVTGGLVRGTAEFLPDYLIAARRFEGIARLMSSSRLAKGVARSVAGGTAGISGVDARRYQGER